MTDKNSLFDINYLENSANFIKDVKEQSYIPFSSLKTGIIADIGCGTGIDAINLAAITRDKNIKIIGLDFQKEMIDEANSNIKDFSNIEFMIGDAENIPFENNYLSGIRNERLLQHLNNPNKAFSEFYRILKVGSPIVILETDWSSMVFYNGSSEITNKIRSFMTNKNVNNAFAAVNLSYSLRENQFKNISLNVYSFISKRLEEVIAFTKLDLVLKQMEEQGYLTKAEHFDFLNDLKIANERKYLNCSLNLVIATATK